MDDYIEYAVLFKALSDGTRLKIIEMLSCGEMCACDILEFFQITQPTLSYHMKILTDCGLVTKKKVGSWIRYNNNAELLENVSEFWNRISQESEGCICDDLKKNQVC